MEEELNEHDMEEKLYAMLHHVDETLGNITTNQNNGLNITVNLPSSNVRRYWHTNESTTQYQKVNTLRDSTSSIIKKQNDTNQNNQPTKPKEEKQNTPVEIPAADMSIFQLPVPQNVQKTIEIIEHENESNVLLESSDEDEVVEVALPPKPTITIESSDEDELQIISTESPSKDQPNINPENKIIANEKRGVSASPVPSIVSSVSDEFIRGDCIALNISSRHPGNASFDFSLHETDLLVQSTPTKKKKKKKAKGALTATPVAAMTPEKSDDNCFATPKSKTRNKKQKNRLYAVTEISLPNADVYDSDSNQSNDTNKNLNYKETEESLPNTDIFESDSLLSELQVNLSTSQKKNVNNYDNNATPHKPNKQLLPISNKNDTTGMNDTCETIATIDLTNETFITLDNLNSSDISESIIMGNVSGFSELDHYSVGNTPENDRTQFGSTKIPAILNEDLDFDNLKGRDKVCKQRRYSLTTLRAEMEKFYNESWGGENFNHREIQKSMSRDKSLWVIDPKDRMPSLTKKKMTCNYCNRAGHRDDMCHMKPPVCYMCGSTGHYEPRCPRKICVNCGSPNQMYSTMCRNCCNWNKQICAECGQIGHPASHCPDLWRRYHNTIDNNTQLERCHQMKKHYQLHCSGCTRRGHLIHTCHTTLPFSGLPINSPYVCYYRPVHPPTAPHNPHIQKKQVDKTTQDVCNATAKISLTKETNKRRSKSPSIHENYINKKRNISGGDDSETHLKMKSPINTSQRKTSFSKDHIDDNKKDQKNSSIDNTKPHSNFSEKALNFIPICSTNHDKKGNMIQDNEVSDTSDVVTSARIYIPNDVINKLKTQEGEKWLKDNSEKHDILVESSEINLFLNITGKVRDQEAFQANLRDWVANKNEENIQSNSNTVTPSGATISCEPTNNNNDFSIIPKKRYNLLRQLGKALDSLKYDLGDPNTIYKELRYLQNRHEQLLKQKVISPQQLANNRNSINAMLKKLNMVLLGQAGLANGSQHVSELYSFQEKLMNSRQKILSVEQRKEIGHHYVSIFTATQRDDYLDLLKMYHDVKHPSALKKKNKKALKLNPKINGLKMMANSIPTQQTVGNIEMNAREEREKKLASVNNSQILTQKLVFYHRRLVNARPLDAALKKTRVDLMRKLYSFISSLFTKKQTSSKALKKIRKTQEQAQLFLANL